MALGGFLVPGVESLGEFHCFAGELHYVLRSLFQILERCSGFVSHRGDAEAGELSFLSVFPGGFLVQTEEDAGASCADEELTPRNLIGILSDLSKLESLVQLLQPVRQDMLAVVILGTALTMELILAAENIFTGCTIFSKN